MKKYKVSTSIEYEIEAESKEEAIDRFSQILRDREQDMPIEITEIEKINPRQMTI